MKKALFIVSLAIVFSISVVGIGTAGSALDRILKKGELVVGISGTQLPLNATTKDGKIIGLDADIAKMMANGMGVSAKFAPMPFKELLPALEAGKVDIVISGMTMTLARNLKVAFVGPYYLSGKGILTKADNIAALQAAEGLNDAQFSVGVLENSTSQVFVKNTAPKAKLVPVKSYDDAVEMLIAGKISALVADYPFCAVSAFRYNDKGLTAGESPLSVEPLGIAMPADTLLINWTQNFLNLLTASGELEKRKNFWFKDASWLSELP